MPIQLEMVITPLPHREGQGVGLFFLPQNLLGVFLHVDLLRAIYFSHDALLVDDECCAVRKFTSNVGEYVVSV